MVLAYTRFRLRHGAGQKLGIDDMPIPLTDPKHREWQHGSSATVVLDASASYDLDNDALSFRWARVDDGEQFFSDGVQTTDVWHGSAQFGLTCLTAQRQRQR